MRKISLGILAILFLLLPFHPFLITFLNSLFFDDQSAPYFFLAAWKEILIFLFALLFVGQIILKKIPFPKIDELDFLIIFFCFWSILIGFLRTGGGLEQIIWGIKFSLLFLIFFFLIRHTPLLPRERNTFFYLFLIAASLTIIFAVSQKMLPDDFLTNFGYSHLHSFGSPDKPLAFCQKVSHTDLCRVQSTFSGPNQFAAFLLIVIPLFLFLSYKTSYNILQFCGFFIFTISLPVLFWTFSRGAWIGAFFGGIVSFATLFKEKKWFFTFIKWFSFLSILGLVFATILVREEQLLEGDSMPHGDIFLALHSRFFWFLLTIFLATFLAIFLKLKNQIFSFFLTIFNFGFFALFVVSNFWGEFFWQIILRPSSSQGHFERSKDGIKYLLENPLGLGLGDAGPASNRFAPDFLGFIPENWFLQVGLESGFIGLITFILIIIFTIKALLKVNNHFGLPLAIALFALCFHALFLHTFESSAVALTFWGLSGIALSEGKKNSFFSKISRFYQRMVLYFKS